MRLHPIKDGVTRRPDERTVTSAPFWYTNSDGSRFINRESLATEVARKSRDEAAPGVWHGATRDGIAIEYQLDRFGNECRTRAARTVAMGDEPLPGLPARPIRTKKSPSPARVKRNTTGSARVVSTGTGKKRDTTDVDRVIRGTGYKGPIDARMRRLARDAMSHRASLAAYTAGAR